MHQSNCTKRLLKCFRMDQATPLSTPMVGRSLNVESDPFRSCEDSEKILGPEVPYMSAIGGLLYLANCTRHDIAFATNLLVRYNSAPTHRHWNGIKHLFRYLQGTVDLGLMYFRKPEFGMVGFADAGYLSDPHKARSQTGYVFTIGGTAISWRSQKTNSGCNFFKLCRDYCASRSMSRMCVVKVNESPHTRFKRNS